MSATLKAVLGEAAETIEALIRKVETDYTEGGADLPEDVAQTLMGDWDLVRRLNEERQKLP